MNETELRNIARLILNRIAPEIESDALDMVKPLRDQVDLDSMDWLNFLVGLNERLHVEIPEVDYAKLVSFDDVVAYLMQRVP